MLPIHSIETFGTHEGPGIRLVIFTQGCNFRCRYCENPDTIPYQATKFISAEEIIDRVKKEMPYFNHTGGVTFSGGEPTIHAEKLIPIFKEIKKLGVHIALDTNGSIRNDSVKELLDLVDLVLPDLKHIDDIQHKDLTGKHNHHTLKFLNYLEENNKHFRVRHVLVPTITNKKEYLEKLGQYLSKFKMMDRLEILPYHELGKHKREVLGRKYTLDDIKPDSKEKIEEAKKILENYLPKVIIRG